MHGQTHSSEVHTRVTVRSLQYVVRPLCDFGSDQASAVVALSSSESDVSRVNDSRYDRTAKDLGRTLRLCGALFAKILFVA